MKHGTILLQCHGLSVIYPGVSTQLGAPTADAISARWDSSAQRRSAHAANISSSDRLRISA